MRFTLGVNKKAPNMGLYGETGRTPIINEAIITSLKYLHHIESQNNDSLLKKAHHENINLIQDHRECWLSHLRKFDTSFNLQWEIRNVSHKNCKQESYQAKQKLKQTFYSYWTDDITTICNKLRTYCLIKTYPQEEKYLTSLKKADRQHLTQLRLSAHSLNIEKLRYTAKNAKIKPEMRLCNNCTKQEVEDEIHFITSCTLYERAREDLYKIIHTDNIYFKHMTNLNKFIYIMTQEKHLKSMAKYVKGAFLIKKQKTSPNQMTPDDK